MFSKSLPIIEIHNRVYALQNITNFIGWYARVNWQCFAKNSQNNGRLILAAKTDLKLFWAVYSISHHIKCHLIDLYNYDCSMINYYICNNKWEWKTAQVETLALWPIRDHHRIYITIYNYIFILYETSSNVFKWQRITWFLTEWAEWSCEDLHTCMSCLI